MLSARYIRKLVIAGALLWLVALVVVVPMLLEMGTARRERGWSSRSPVAPVVQSVMRGGPADGLLQPGDRILSIDGQSGFAGQYTPTDAVLTYPAGKPYLVTFLRHGTEHRVTLRADVVSDRSVVAFLCLDLLGSVTFLVIGILMGWQRPGLRTARLGWLACTLTAIMYLYLALLVLQVQGWYTGFAFPVLGAIGSLDILAGWWFVADFAAPAAESRGWKAVRLLLLVVFLTHWLSADIVSPALQGFRLHPEFLLFYPRWWTAWTNSFYITSQLVLLAALPGVLVRNYRAADTADSRRRIGIVTGAVVVGAGLTIIAGLWQIRLVQAGLPDAANRALMLGNCAPLIIPWFFYYAVVRHRVLDIRVVIRRGLRYLLAREFLRLITILPLPLILYRAASNPQAPIGSVINLGGIAVVIAAIALLEFRGPVLAAVDRWFFREVADRETSVRSLFATIGRLSSYEDIVNTVEVRLAAIFMASPVQIVTGSPVAAAEGGLALPICSPGGQYAGQLLMGCRKSEEPYTPAERELLETLATQIGLVSENLQLAARRFDAVLAERTRIARELHDTLSQSFSGISLHLEAVRTCMHADPQKARDLLDAASAVSRAGIQDARNALRELRTPPVRNHLVTRLRSLGSDHLSGPKISIHIEESLAQLVPAEAGWHLARIAEEAVTNARKHAGATDLRVQFTEEGGQLMLRIRDNGVGFDLAAVTRGLGLLGMRERMALAGGSVEIASQSGKGTEICASITPLEFARP